MKHIYTFLCLFLFCGVTNADQWLCIGDKSVGFYYDENRKSWVDSNFSVKNSKYIFRRYNENDDGPVCRLSGDDKTGRWGLFRFGGTCMGIDCRLGHEFDPYDRITCDSAQEKFLFSRKTLRFALLVGSSYFWAGSGEHYSDSEAGTPYIELGQCSTF